MFNKRKTTLTIQLAVLSFAPGYELIAAEAVEEIIVVGIIPGSQALQSLNKVPYAIHSTRFTDMEAARTLDVSDYLNSRLGSVNINSAQNNPLQADLQYRGFTASPLLGLPQGLSVYQNGQRINEPLGDSVNWDLLPESAIYSMDLMSGSNPVFGLNTLGGAMAITMKNGFNYVNRQIEASTGSWGRTTAALESSANNGTWGYYLNLGHFQEDGWRQMSSSDSSNIYGTLNWRDAERSALDFVYQHGRSDLIGNGALPAGLAALERNAVYTAPDITKNSLHMLDFSGSHAPTDTVRFSGNAYRRRTITDAFNGDGSEFEACEFAGGAQALFEESDGIEDALENLLDIELDDICDGNDQAIESYADLEDLIAARALQKGLNPNGFKLEDIVDELTGSGIISDEAINNISVRQQTMTGLNGQMVFSGDLLSRMNQFITGYSYSSGESSFESVLELARLDPVTRSTKGLGVGTYFDEAATDIDTRTETLSWYFTDTLTLTPLLAITFSGRYNRTDVTLRDRSGKRPELNGDHRYSRLNPALGINWNPSESVSMYASISESNRVPTPIELACNEGIFELARQYAIDSGEDPDDVEFECRLPNAFLADPPLDDVVTRNLELGMRGNWNTINYQWSLYQADNRDDILFQTTGRSTGLFANAGETRREGFEIALNRNSHKIDWYTSVSLLGASFENELYVLSPNHPEADSTGKLLVKPGDRIPGIPEKIIKAGANYQITESLSLGAEIIYNANQIVRGDESNQLASISSYTLTNLHATYALGNKLSMYMRVSNLFDHSYENFALLGEDPNEILPDLADNRRLYLGVGAPRAAWVGVTLKF